MKSITTYREAKRIEYKEEQIRNRDANAWKKVMSTKEGRWFFMRLLDRTGYKAKSFTGNSHTFYNDGRREIGIELVDQLNMMHPHDGFIWTQKAEKEYVDFQEAIEKFLNAQEEEGE